MTDIRRLVRSYVLLSRLRSKQGRQFSQSNQRSIKRLIAFNIIRKHLLKRKGVPERVRRPRRFHVRRIFADRKVHGAWYTLIPLMREHDEKSYFDFMRMTPASFDDLLELVTPALQKKSHREPIPPGERLAVTLRYLASGDSMASLSYLFRISNQAISKIIIEVTAAIWFSLKNLVFEPLSPDFWRRKAAEFESMWQFPMCVGAIDGKHCSVQQFPMRGSEHFNYKLGHSLVLLAVSDAKYRFIAVDVGARGRESDGGVFERSAFGEMFANRLLELPPPVYNDDVKDFLPYVFLGDDTFTFDVNLMKPFDSNYGDKPEEIVFNYRLSRARRVVENSFGILSARFRIFRRSIIGSEILAQNIILATIALHNLHLFREDSIPPKQRMYLPEGYADTLWSNGKVKQGRWRNEDKKLEQTIFRKLQQQSDMPSANVNCADTVRENFLKLFIARPLPWQYDQLPIV